MSKIEKLTISIDVTSIDWFKGFLDDLAGLPDRIDQLKLCSHEYKEDVGDFVRAELDRMSKRETKG